MHRDVCDRKACGEPAPSLCEDCPRREGAGYRSLPEQLRMYRPSWLKPPLGGPLGLLRRKVGP